MARNAHASCASAAGEMVGWWRAEGNGNDQLGGSPALAATGVQFTTATVGQGFLLNNSSNAYLRIPATTALNVGTSNGFTIEAWIRLNDVSGFHPILEYHDGTNNVGVHMWVGHSPWDSGVLYANIIDTFGNAHQIFSDQNVLVTNVDQHVALTFNRLTGEANLFVNGVNAAQSSIGSITPLTSFDIWVGKRPNDAPGSWTDGTFLNGILDELTIYGRALGTNELTAIYQAGAEGKCVSPAFPCAQAPAGLVSWWRAENTGLDASSTNHGQLSNGATFSTGNVGQAFQFNGTNAEFRVPGSVSLDVGTSAGFTIEGWINPAVVDVLQPIAEWNSGSAWGAHFYIDPFSWGAGPGSLYANIVDAGGGWHQIQSPSGTIAPNSFQHVAVTYDRASGLARLYRNGEVVTQQFIGNFTPHTSYDLYIGRRPGGDATYSFRGRIDEISLYNRALATNEVLAIYAAGAAGKCVPEPQAECSQASQGIVSWWRAENTGFDAVGLNHGQTENGVTFAAGQVGNALEFSGTNAAFRVAASTSLDVGVGVGFTIEGWVNPAAVDVLQPIAEWNSGSAWGAHFYVDPFSWGAGPGSLYANIVDAGGGWHQIQSPAGVVLANTFQHVAVTYDKTSGLARLYCNGSVVSEQSIGSFTPHTSYDFYLGRRPGGDATYSYNGKIDEIALYNRALTTNELAAIFAAGSAGKCVATSTECAPAPGGLVSWWQAENNAMDSLNTHHGVFTGSTGFTGGRKGLSFSFDGSDDAVRIPYAPGLVSSNFTVEGWISPAVQVNDAINQEVIFGQNFGAMQLVVRGGSSGQRVAWQFGTSSMSFYEVEAPVEIPIGQFSHLAGTWDGQALRLYINGSLVASNFPGAIPVDSGCDFFIGGFDIPSGPCGYVGQFFNGVIDEVSLYKRALAAGEIAAIYEAGSAGKCPPVQPPSPRVPVIHSFSPMRGSAGTNVVITGTNFSATALSNIVFFGSVKAQVISATPAQLTVVVPMGSVYGPISVTVAGLSAHSDQAFIPSFIGQPFANFVPENFGLRVDLPTGAGPSSAVIADLDNDGKPDLAVNNGGPDTVSIFRNISSNGSPVVSFASRIDVPFNGAGENEMLAVDVDGDGRLDLVGLNRNAQKLVVLKNFANPGSINVSNFSLALTLSTGGDPRGIAVRDLNRDGKLDFAVANWADSTVSVYRNTGVAGTISSNNFAVETFAAGVNPQSVEIQDIDGDGAPELITANHGGIRGISILANWSTASDLEFGSHVDIAGPAGTYGLAVGDLDLDGKSDVVISSQEGSQLSIYRNTSLAGWITNTSFAARIDLPVGAWANSVAIGDVDGDGRPDLAAADQLPSRISLFRNLTGPGTINTNSFATRVDLPAPWNPNGMAIGDLNGDGRPDLAFANSYENSVSVYPNLIPYFGATPPGALPVIYSFSPISAAPGASITVTGTNFSTSPTQNIVYFGAVRAAVTSAGSNQVIVVVPAGATFSPISLTVGAKTALSPKPFFPTYPSGSPLTTNSFGPRIDMAAGDGPARTAVADFDRDGRVDLVVANIYDGSVLIYRNVATNGVLGASSFAPPFRFVIGGGSDSVWALTTGDLDGDGRLDLVVGNRTLHLISVFQNVSTNGVLSSNSFAARFDIPVAATPRAVKLADLDADGRVDLIFADEANNRLGILRNIWMGPGLLSTNSFDAAVYRTVGNVPVSIALGDLDGDGRMDVVAGNYSSGTASVLRKTNSLPGSFGFSAPITLTTGAGTETVAIGDLDGDGKLDLVTGAWSAATIRVHRNTSIVGSISFSSGIAFAAGGSVHDVALGDLDGDAKLDVALVREQPSGLSLFRNLASAGAFTAASLASPLDFGSGWNPVGVVLADFDLDGRSDIAFGNAYSATVSIYKNISAPICLSVPHGIVSWWRAEANGLDSAGTNNAVSEGVGGFTTGKIGQAFSFNNTNGWLRVPRSVSLNVGLSSGFTIEGWLNLRDVTNKHSIAEWNTGSAWGVHFHIDPFSFSAGPGTMYANIVDTGGGWHQFRSASGVVTANGFHHVALTYDKTTGIARIFRDGTVVAQQSIGSFTPQTSFDLYLARRPGDELIGFNGLLDELSLYNRALTTNEIAAIYNAGGLGKCFTNSAPMAVPDSFTSASNTPVSFAAAKLLLNDMDPDGDALTVVSVGTNSSYGGTVWLNGGTISYEPASGFSGTDMFSYMVSDGKGGTAAGTVFVTIGSGGPVGLNIVFGPVVVGNSFVVNFAGIPGLTYTIEAAPALNGPWTKITNMTAPSINTGNGVGVFQVSEPIGSNATRFYRTIYPAY